MKSIRWKIVIGILVCSIFTAVLIGIVSIYDSMMIANKGAKSQMQMTTRVYTDDLDATISSIGQSVDTLSDMLMKNFDYESFIQNKEYADKYTEQIEETVIDFAMLTEGAITAYVRYNPEYSNPTSGVFLSRNSKNEAFEALVPTDFSMYDEDDVSHVGWYYVPIKNGSATWMEPYLNENINVYMISYIVYSV